MIWAVQSEGWVDEFPFSNWTNYIDQDESEKSEESSSEVQDGDEPSGSDEDSDGEDETVVRDGDRCLRREWGPRTGY